MYSPSPPDHSTEKDSNPAEPVGSVGSKLLARWRPISIPSAYSTASTASSISVVPAFSKKAVIVTSSFGLGALGLNSIARPSNRGLTSASAVEITVSPRTMSNVASPSMSAKAGDDQVLWSISTSLFQLLLIAA